jgi:hypothetical protein
MTKKTKPPVFTHRDFVLVRRHDKTVDVCDPVTATWVTFKTERHAKWSATVFSNLAEKFRRPRVDYDTVMQLEQTTLSNVRQGWER